MKPQELTREKITELREAAGLSKSALARIAELHVSTVSQIETGRLNPYPKQLEKLAAAFDKIANGQA